MVIATQPLELVPKGGSSGSWVATTTLRTSWHNVYHTKSLATLTSVVVNGGEIWCDMHYASRLAKWL